MIINIRPANPEDLEYIESLYRMPELATATGDYLTVDDFRQYLDNQYFLVAEDDHKIIGAITAESIKAAGVIIWFLATLPEYRNQGIGGRLLESVEKNAIKDGKTWLVLYAAKKDDRTVVFYQNKDFIKGSTYQEMLKLI